MSEPARPPQMFLSRAQFEERIGLRPGGLSGAMLPAPDAVIGPINKDGSLPPSTARGWLPETIDQWKRSRVGQGARTDLQPEAAREWAANAPRTSTGNSGRGTRESRGGRESRRGVIMAVKPRLAGFGQLRSD